MTPDDLATIYNISPLYRAGFDGTGQRLAVVGQSAILLSDIRLFRSVYGLSPKDPEVWVLGPDPGISPDQDEANLDVEWAGAVARNATIVYEYAKDVFDAAQDVIDNQRAPVLSMSFGGCELTLGNATYYRTLAQKAIWKGSPGWPLQATPARRIAILKPFLPPLTAYPQVFPPLFRSLRPSAAPCSTKAWVRFGRRRTASRPNPRSGIFRGGLERIRTYSGPLVEWWRPEYSVLQARVANWTRRTERWLARYSRYCVVSGGS